MLTMCVMDDIKMVVNGIAYQIPWEQHGIRIVGTAEDGQRGLEMIRALRPDIVLTDICMPHLGGCDMIRQMIEEHLPSKVIFMSGFNDFTYAQEAVRLGAFDYLSKPFTPAQVVESVLKVREAIVEESEKAAKMRLLEMELLQNRRHQRDDFLRKLLHHAPSLDAERQWKSWQLHKMLPCYRTLILDTERADPGKSLVKMSEQVIAVLRELLEEREEGIVLHDGSQRIVALLPATDAIDMESLWQEATVCIEQDGAYQVSVGYSTVHAAPAQLAYAYREADRALEYRFYSSTGGCYSYERTERTSDIPRYAPDKEKALLYAFRSGNAEQTTTMLDELFLEWISQSDYCRPELMVQQFKTLCMTVYRTMLDVLEDLPCSGLAERLARIQSLPLLTFTAWMTLTNEFCCFCCEYIRSQQNKEYSQVIQQVKRYIEEHLDSDLTVSSCARAVHLSPSYLANLFKRETAMTLANYVTNLRIEKAKQWLLEGMQVQLISARLGYEDRPYFSEMFKKHCGMTPSMFRQHYFEQQNLKKR
ncbi:helix-turn-helix domain-containing protein [Paenibacillus campi]|uniref:helix-turn-helix domain-containing protein n=1 Tax=Paenibacillus campi TaxID=3106031 RepID=UPI002AFF2127|nr:helix-turn-helix domain-containing protein [Paenibacillus sp. SGZ-1014]